MIKKLHKPNGNKLKVAFSVPKQKKIPYMAFHYPLFFPAFSRKPNM